MKKWGNVESESLSIYSFSLHFLILSPFPLHFLILFHFLASRMQGCSKLCNPDILFSQSFSILCTIRAILSSGRCTNCQWTVHIFIIAIVLYSHSIILSFSIPCTIRAILSSGKCTNCQWTGRWGVPELLITGKAV